MDDVIRILGELISFPTVVGTSNRDIVTFISGRLKECGATVAVLPGPEGDRSNIFASFGPTTEAGLVLSGHMDVVPARQDEWSGDPFILRRDGERLYGRGTTDMKGFLAAMLAIVPYLGRMKLRRPLHMAFSYDEEAGCIGVPHLIKQIPELCVRPFGCIVGEPSGLSPVRAHKGKAAVRISIEGLGGHSSRPDLGLNAIAALGVLLQAATEQAEQVQRGRQDPIFQPAYSTLQVGICRGGEALNIIPAHAEMEMEARAIPGVDPATVLAPVLDKIPALEKQGYKIRVTRLSNYPGLMLDASAPLTALVSNASGRDLQDAVSYGTEAGLFQAAGIPSIICGPGDIAQAHRPNEYILASELHDCVSFLKRVTSELA